MYLTSSQPCCTLSCCLLNASLQDTVPRGGKFISAYKRNGQRVIVNKAGDMVVSSKQPTLDSSMQQV
jgi:hypothetical protein